MVLLLTLRVCNPQTFHNVLQNQCSEIQTPQYLRYHSRVNSEHMVNASIAYSIPTNGLASTYSIAHHYPQGVTNSTLCRAGSDDVNFGTFISIPPMYQYNGAEPQ